MHCVCDTPVSGKQDSLLCCSDAVTPAQLVHLTGSSGCSDILSNDSSWIWLRWQFTNCILFYYYASWSAVLWTLLVAVLAASGNHFQAWCNWPLFPERVHVRQVVPVRKWTIVICGADVHRLDASVVQPTMSGHWEVTRVREWSMKWLYILHTCVYDCVLIVWRFDSPQSPEP